MQSMESLRLVDDKNGNDPSATDVWFGRQQTTEINWHSVDTWKANKTTHGMLDNARECESV